MLATAQPQQQKLRVSVHPMVQSIVPDLAHKISGIYNELNNSELLHMLESRESFKAKVDETLTILREQMQLFAVDDRLFPVIQSMVPDLDPGITHKSICLNESELLHVFDSNEFLKAEDDETVAISKQKQMLGEMLFPHVKVMVQDLAPKITAWLLEDNNSALLRMLKNHKSLKARVDEVVTILRAHQVCSMHGAIPR